MKKLVLLIILLGSFVSFSQENLSEKEKVKRQKNLDAVNPFHKFGYKAKVATLSKGKYLEMFISDSIVQIGSFHYNIISNKVTGFTQLDTLYSEATLRPEVVSRWINPDPLSDEFPDKSPYNFVNNNPIYFIDTTGLAPQDWDTDYKLDKKSGKVSRVDENDGTEKNKYDRLYATDDAGEVIYPIEPLTIYKKNRTDNTILTSLSKQDPNYVANTYWGNFVGSWGKTSNYNTAFSVFKFGSDNSNVEWALEQHKGSRFLVGTNHYSESVASLYGVAGYSATSLLLDYHSHPGTSPSDDVASGMIGDQGAANRIIWKFLDKKIPYSKHPKFKIYRPALNKRFEYSPWSKKFNSKKVKTIKDL